MIDPEDIPAAIRATDPDQRDASIHLAIGGDGQQHLEGEVLGQQCAVE